MKKSIIFLLIVCLLLIPNMVKAADGKLKPGDIEMECVYENGMSISVYYAGGAYSMSSSTFKIADKIQFPYNTSFTIFYKEGEWAKEIIQSATCPNTIEQHVVEQSDGETKVTFQVIHKPEHRQKVISFGSEADRDFLCSQVVAGFEPKPYYTTGGSSEKWCATNVFFKIDKNSSIGRRGAVYMTGDDTKWTSFWFSLKSERFYLTGDTEPAKQFAFKSEGKQAASNPNYVTISYYTNENGNSLQLVEKDNTITKLQANYNWDELDFSEKVRFICLKTSVKEIDSDKNDISYRFSDIRSNIEKSSWFSAKWATAYRNPEKFNSEELTKILGDTKMIECSNGYSLYGGVLLSEIDENVKDGTSICDVIPETAIFIAKWIRYAGYLVPVFLIVLTTIDITKLVLSGDLEEELPKKKKIIIIRFIVAVAFFFLPLFIELFITINNDTKNGRDYGDISCLYD